MFNREDVEEERDLLHTQKKRGKVASFWNERSEKRQMRVCQVAAFQREKQSNVDRNCLEIEGSFGIVVVLAMAFEGEKEAFSNVKGLHGILERECRKRNYSSVPKVEEGKEKGDFNHFEIGKIRKELHLQLKQIQT